MFERFTDRARRVLVLAQEEARLLNHSFIGTEHILLGILREGEGLGAKALEALGISLGAAREKVEEVLGPVSASSGPLGSPPFTPRAKKVLELSLREALQLGHNYIGTEHILIGLIDEGQGVAAEALQQLGAELSSVREKVLELLTGSPGGAGSGLRPVRRSGARLIPELRHPERVVPGPVAQLTSDGVTFRVVGALCFLDRIRVLWRLSGVSETFVETMPEHAVFPGLVPEGKTLIFVTVADDLGTNYGAGSVQLDRQPNGEWAGNSFFRTAVPDGAVQLTVRWQGEVLTLDLVAAA